MEKCSECLYLCIDRDNECWCSKDYDPPEDETEECPCFREAEEPLPKDWYRPDTYERYPE